MLEVVLFSVGQNKINLEIEKEKIRVEKIQKTFDDLPIMAKAISIYDITDGEEIYGKNQNESLPFASLAKTMTILVALENYSVDDTILISRNAIKQAGNSGLFVNEKWNISDLAKITLVASLNDSAYAFTENIENSLEKMNNKAKSIGMSNTKFLNSTGLDLPAQAGIDEGIAGLPVQAGAYSSALDANRMAIYAFKIYSEIFSATVLPEMNIKSESGFEHKIINTNIILDKIPNILFSKTGYTELAGGNLSIIFKNKNDHEIAITILGSTFDGRFSDMENLVNTLYNLDHATGN